MKIMTFDTAIHKELSQIALVLKVIDRYNACTNKMFMLTPMYDALKLGIDYKLERVKKLKTMRAFITQHLN